MEPNEQQNDLYIVKISRFVGSMDMFKYRQTQTHKLMEVQQRSTETAIYQVNSHLFCLTSRDLSLLLKRKVRGNKRQENRKVHCTGRKDVINSRNYKFYKSDISSPVYT